MRLVPLLLLGACADPVFRLGDDVDLTLDLPEAGPDATAPEATLHTPYVQGAAFNLLVDPSNDRPLKGWTVESTDPDVLAVDVPESESDGLRVPATAVGAGTTEVVVFDDAGEEVLRSDVEVVFPDRFELRANGPLSIGATDTWSLVEAPTVLVWGTAAFELSWFAGDEALHGSGALSVDASDALGAHARTSYLMEDREWLVLEPGAAGTETITVNAAGVAVGSVDVTVVESSAIATVTATATEDLRHLASGDGARVLMRARTSDGTAIDGVPFAWEFDGEALEGEGDLLDYTFDPEASANVTAANGGATGAVTIHASEPGDVASSGSVGCSVLGFGSLGAAATWLGAAMALGRRRR
jgi:hypothetical protein